MEIKLKKVSIGLFSVFIFTSLLVGSVRVFADAMYYDAYGNIISADEYRNLTGQPRSLQDKPASPEASPKMVESSGTESVQPEEKLPPEKLPATTTEFPALAETTKNGNVLPVAENETGKPILPEDKPQTPTFSAGRQTAPEEAQRNSLYEATITSNTLFRAFQRDTDKKNDAGVFPLYEYLQIDLDTLEKGWSLHTYGWGRYDFSESEFYNDNPEGELLYGYIEYHQPDYGLNLKLGRQHVFEGIINSSIDGLGFKSILTPYFNFSFYGGFPVALSSDKGRSGDSFWGGRVAGHIGSRYEIGLSYKLENSDGEKDIEMLGIDFSLTLPKDAYLRGLSSYNLNTSGWGQHFFEAGIDIANFHFRPVYERYQYDDFFNSKDNSADPFRFLAGTHEILTVIGSDILWKGFAMLDLGAKIIHYNYDLRNDEAMYYEGNLTCYVNGFSQVGGQIGRMDGGTPETAYYLTRAFFYLKPPRDSFPLGFVTGDIVYVRYDREIFGRDGSLFLSLGTGAKFFNDSMEVKLSGDYSSDPYFDSDLRVMLTIIFQKNIRKTSGRDSHSGAR